MPSAGGAPPVPAEAREDLLALKSGGVFVCVRRNGDIAARPVSGMGLYTHDTRHLSELYLTVGGERPVSLSAAMESGHHAVINATNPTLGSDQAIIAQETTNIRRTIVVGEQLHSEVSLRSFAGRPLATSVGLSLAADFADVFEVRQFGRQTSGQLLEPVVNGSMLTFGYLSADGERRTTCVQLSPPPARLEVDGERALAVWEVELLPGHPVALGIVADPAGEPAPVPGHTPETPSLRHVAAGLDNAYLEWERGCTRIATDNDLVDRLFDASMRDLYALMMPAQGGSLPAAGIPWYVAPFGRDSLLTAGEMLMVDSGIARGTLHVLAALQARKDDAWRDAEPGKILHELRTGELARTGSVPHTPYYGTVDATPLFLMLAGSYFRWTHDLETMTLLTPALDAALAWIDRWGDLDGDGFIEYQRRSEAGLVNHGWKDSHDSIVHADGSLAEGPIALVEAQAYVYAAKQQIAGVYDELAQPERAAALRAQAAALRVAFNDAFWDPEQAYYVLALDGHKQQVRSVTSNAAHCLYCGIADADKAAIVARRLMEPDMFSGWGIRTLSRLHPAFNPMSYHNGSVWPHDNAIAAAGLKRYGYHDAAARIAQALFEVASGARDLRLPELVCGVSRDESRSIVSYPVACIPQAWAAAAPFMLLQSLLGISAQAPSNRLTVEKPTLPPWLQSVDVRELHVGGSRVSLAFRRTGPGTTGFSLLANAGELHVTMSA